MPPNSRLGSSDSRRGPGSSQTFAVRLYYNTPGAPQRVIINLDDSGSSDCHLIVATFTPRTDVSRCVLASPEILSFGTIPIGQTIERTVTLSNHASTSLSGVVTFSAPGYSVLGDASYALAAGASKTFTIRFTPTSALPYWGTMFTGVGQSVLLEGSGVVA